MSFFKKLKDRLFRSSSKLEEGIDHIVKDGGLGEPEGAPEPTPEHEVASEPTPKLEVAPEPTPEPEAVPESTSSFQEGINPSNKSTKVVLDDEKVSEPVKTNFFKRKNKYYNWLLLF